MNKPHDLSTFTEQTLQQERKTKFRRTNTGKLNYTAFRRQNHTKKVNNSYVDKRREKLSIWVIPGEK